MKTHWNYFLALEADLEVCSRYVDFSADNFNVFSIEFAKILQASSSEIDVVAKILCKKIASGERRRNIDDYRNVILSKYSKFSEVELKIERYCLNFTPWSEWKNGNNPSWWKSYNNVKHERDRYFSEASLENVLNSMAGLMCILLYCFSLETNSNSNEISLPKGTKLFEPKWYGFGEPASISALYSIPKEP